MNRSFKKRFSTCLISIIVIGGTAYFSYNMGSNNSETLAPDNAKQETTQKEVSKTILPFEEKDLENLNKLHIKDSREEEGRTAVFFETDTGSEELIVGDDPQYFFSPDKKKVLLLETTYADTIFLHVFL